MARSLALSSRNGEGSVFCLWICPFIELLIYKFSVILCVHFSAMQFLKRELHGFHILNGVRNPLEMLRTEFAFTKRH